MFLFLVYFLWYQIVIPKVKNFYLGKASCPLCKLDAFERPMSERNFIKQTGSGDVSFFLKRPEASVKNALRVPFCLNRRISYNIKLVTWAFVSARSRYRFSDALSCPEAHIARGFTFLSWHSHESIGREGDLSVTSQNPNGHLRSDKKKTLIFLRDFGIKTSKK